MSIEAVQRVIWTYLDGLYEGDVGKLAAAFHPRAHLHSLAEGRLTAEPRDAWLDRVKARPSPRSLGHERSDRILTVDFADPRTALVKCACAVPPRYFTDYLTLLETAEGWTIVTKTFCFEERG
jgi:hypothetical protein